MHLRVGGERQVRSGVPDLVGDPVLIASVQRGELRPRAPRRVRRDRGPLGQVGPRPVGAGTLDAASQRGRSPQPPTPRKRARPKGHFPNEDAARKLIYLCDERRAGQDEDENLDGRATRHQNPR